jgi:hypothetical protein
MRKTISAMAIFSVSLFAANSHAALNEKEVLERLESLQKTVAAQQELINELKKQVEQNKEQTGSGTESSAITLANKAIDQLKIKGDLRVRYERRDTEYEDSNDDYARDRWRTRFRIGGVWKNKKEDWEVGAGLATGGSGATSTNDTWSDDSPFETGDIRLDYAYAKHKIDDFAFTLGQHKNPLKTSWVMWDGDVRLAGLTAKYKNDGGLFAVLGGYGASYDGDNMAMLYAGQLGFTGKADKLKYTVAAGYHTYDKSFINDDDGDNFLGNINPDDYELNIGDIYADISIPLGKAKVKFYGQYWQNFGADGAVGESQATSYIEDPEDADTGWVFGLDTKINKFKVGYAYSVVEADSLYGYLADADFGDNIADTNKKGHKFKLGYSFTKNWSTGLTYLSYEYDEDHAGLTKDSVDLLQVDMKYKF